MAVIKFPKKGVRVRKSAVSPAKRFAAAANDLIDAVGAEAAYHEIADIADKLRRSLRKAAKASKG